MALSDADKKLFSELEGLLLQTGLSSRELAPLFKTTQTTVLAWMGRKHNQKPGSPPRQELLQQYAVLVIHLLKRIVVAGDLPLSPDVPQKDRAQMIQMLCKKHRDSPARREGDKG